MMSVSFPAPVPDEGSSAIDKKHEIVLNNLLMEMNRLFI